MSNTLLLIVYILEHLKQITSRFDRKVKQSLRNNHLKDNNLINLLVTSVNRVSENQCFSTNYPQFE